MSESLDKQIDELLESSSSNWFLTGEAVYSVPQQNALPKGIESVVE